MDISRFLKDHNFLVASLSFLLAAILFIAVSVQAATTISTNIDTGGTLAVTGASTLTGAVSASSTMQVTGAVTTYGNSTFGDAATDVNLFTGTLQASTTALLGGATTFYGNLTVDQSATTTVTFSDEGINFDANTFVIDPNANRVGIASSSPYVALGVVGTTTSSLGTVIGGTGSGITQLLFGTCTIDSESITASTTLSTNCTGATGVRNGDRVFLTPNSLENGLIMTSASSTATNDVIQASIFNIGLTGDIDPASATWDWMAIR